jgi:hypothetical protein
MGYAELGLGNLKNSREYLCEGLIRSKEFGIVSTMIYALVGFGHLWAVEGKAVQAVEVFTLAMNHPVTSGLYKDFAQRELEQLQEQMTEERFRAAQERGKASALETIVEKILNE